MPARTPVIAGNWKMNPMFDAAVSLADALCKSLKDFGAVERVICPPFLYIPTLRNVVKDSGVGLGAQNCHWEDKGAYTGEVSAAMLVDLVEYVIIGHSERRQYFGETDESVRKKVEAALRHGLQPITCVGETLEQREGNETEAVLRRQVTEGVRGITLPPSAIIAYEPVWAIGTGRAATSEMANEAIGFIRRVVGEEHGAERAADVRILYGGSVTGANAAELLGQPEIDGALVGGASLKAEDFTAIVRAAL
jgi:triosephosphate isomerase